VRATIPALWTPTDLDGRPPCARPPPTERVRQRKFSASYPSPPVSRSSRYAITTQMRVRWRPQLASKHRVEVVVGQEVESADGHVLGLWTPGPFYLVCQRTRPWLSFTSRAGLPSPLILSLLAGGTDTACAEAGARYDRVQYDGIEVANSTPLLFFANFRARGYRRANRHRLAAPRARRCPHPLRDRNESDGLSRIDRRRPPTRTPRLHHARMGTQLPTPSRLPICPQGP
jgi:hypothetical protein